MRGKICVVTFIFYVYIVILLAGINMAKKTQNNLSIRLRQVRWKEMLDQYGVAVEHFPQYVNLKRSMHGIDFVLLSFILRGTGMHYIGDDHFEESGASLGVTHYGQQHDIVTSPDGMEVINVFLDLERHPLPSLPQELQPVLPQLLPLHPNFVHRLNRIVRLQFDDPEPMAGWLLAMEREMTERRPGHRESIQLYWKLFLIHCCRHALERGFVKDVPGTRPQNPPLDLLRQFLDKSYAEPHTLGALAERAGLAPTSLCRAFKAYTGKRLFDYLTERRIQAAMLALRTTDDKVLSIALDCGFQDLSHFNRKFKQRVGISPTKYRRGIARA